MQLLTKFENLVKNNLPIRRTGIKLLCRTFSYLILRSFFLFLQYSASFNFYNPSECNILHFITLIQVLEEDSLCAVGF